MTAIPPIFLNPREQQDFDRDGYVKVSLLTEPQTKQLYQIYKQSQAAHELIPSKYQATTHTNDPELISAIDAKIMEVVSPAVAMVLRHYSPMMCTYITKQPGIGSETALHQDPTFVDEVQYVSANVWIALHDINHENGNLFFIKGSHRMMPSLRVTPDCPTAYDNVKDLLPKYITEIPVKAGEAIIINHATVHGATPNLSNDLRIAAVMAIRSETSTWLYHYLERGASYDAIERYLVNRDTFMNLQKDGRPPQEQFEKYISWDFPQVDRESFIQQMEQDRRISLWQGIRSFFNLKPLR